MADVTLYGSALDVANLPQFGGCALMGPYFTTQSVGYFFGIDNSSGDFVYWKTTNGGASWGSLVVVATNASNSPGSVSTFADWIVPGDAGTKIHIAWVNEDASTIQYRSLDTASDTLGTIRTFTPAALTPTTVSTTNIAKARNGNLYIRYSVGTTEVGGLIRSVDAGVNWTARTSPMEGAQADGMHCILLPATGTGDDADMFLVYGDQSANAVTLKTYDDSANSWSESASITTGVVLGATDYRQVSAAVRHSDGHLILAINTHIDNAAADLLIFDITNGTTWSAKTNIITNIDDWATVAVFIDQNTNDLYVGWLGNPAGTDTWGTTVNPYYAKSTDGGTTWGSSTLYAEGVSDNYRALWCPVSTKGAAAGRFILAWFDDDDNDYWTNAVNSVAIAAAVVKSRPVFANRSLRFVRR